MPARLSLDLVPSTCWWSNLRTILPQEDWDALRRRCYRDCNYRCQVCGGKGPEHPVECHEIWSYDEENSVQKLERVIGLCPACHKVKHFGLARIRGESDVALSRLCKVNGWSEKKAKLYVKAEFAVWKLRSEKTWSLDLSALKRYGITPPDVGEDGRPGEHENACDRRPTPIEYVPKKPAPNEHVEKESASSERVNRRNGNSGGFTTTTLLEDGVRLEATAAPTCTSDPLGGFVRWLKKAPVGELFKTHALNFCTAPEVVVQAAAIIADVKDDEEGIYDGGGDDGDDEECSPYRMFLEDLMYYGISDACDHLPKPYPGFHKMFEWCFLVWMSRKRKVHHQDSEDGDMAICGSYDDGGEDSLFVEDDRWDDPLIKDRRCRKCEAAMSKGHRQCSYNR